MSIEIVNGRVFVEGKETIDPALIGYAVLDMAEESQNVSIHPITDKRLLQIINNQSELTTLNSWLEKELQDFIPDLHNNICRYWEQRKRPFEVNWLSSDILFNLIMMIKNGQLIFKENKPHESVVKAGEKLKERLEPVKDKRCGGCGGLIGPMQHKCR